MADEEKSDEANQVQQRDSDDGEIEGDQDDETPAVTGAGARPKTTVTTVPAKAMKAARQPSRREPNVQQRRETRATVKARQEAAGPETAPPAGDVEPPLITINGQSQVPVDRTEQNYQYQSSRQTFGLSEATRTYNLPPASDYDFQTRFRRHDDDDNSEHNYPRSRRTQSADEKSRYTFEEWAEQILNSPHMRKYMITRQAHVGHQPQFYQPFQPVNYPTYSHQNSVANQHDVHLFVPPAPTPPGSNVISTSVASVSGPHASQQRGQSADAQLGSSNRTPTQKPSTTHHARTNVTSQNRRDGARGDTSMDDNTPLDTSTPTAETQHNNTSRRSRRDSAQRTPTLDVSNQSNASARRRKSKSNKIEFVPPRDTSDTRETSTYSDTEDNRGGSKTRVRIPTFNGTDFQVYKELFTTSAEYAGWSEKEKKINIINGLKKPATDILRRPGRRNWSSQTFMDELEKAYGQNRPFIEVQTELLSMKRKLKQDLYAFASELRAVATQAQMDDVQREWLLRTAFMLGIENYPNTRAYVERESKDKNNLQEAVDLAIKYERDYPIERTASRIASHTAQPPQHEEGQFCDPNDAEINWIPRGQYNSRFQRGGRQQHYGGGYRNFQQGYNRQYQPQSTPDWQQKVYELERELEMWRSGNQQQQQGFQQQQQPQTRPPPARYTQQQQPAYGGQYYSQQYRNRDNRHQQNTRPYRGNFGQQPYRQQQFAPQYQQQWQPRPQQQYQQRTMSPRHQGDLGARQQQPAVQAVQTPAHMMTSNDDYANTAPMMPGNPTPHEFHDPAQQTMFQEEPQMMAAPAEDIEEYDAHSQEHSQEE